MSLVGSDPPDRDSAVSTTTASGIEELLTVTREITSAAMILTAAGEIDPMNASRLGE